MPGHEGRTVSILLGSGDGTFHAAQSYAAGALASSIAVGDFNGDGYPDLAVVGYSGASILLGNGDGTFQAAQNYMVGSTPVSVAAGDFNGDGQQDLSVTNYFGPEGSLLGQGHSSLTPPHTYPVR